MTRSAGRSAPADSGLGLARSLMAGEQANPLEVKWYHSDAAKTLGDGINLPAKNELFELSDRDTVALEAAFRRHPDDYIMEWKRGDEALSAPLQEPEQAGKVAPVQADLEPRGPILRDGFFEANVAACQMYPIYWQDQPRALIRGTWFMEAASLKGRLLPLPHAAALVLEHAWQSGAFDSAQAPHMRQPEGVVAARVHLGDTLSHPYDALFCSRDTVFLCAGSTAALANPRYDVRSGQPGMRLRRGFRDGASGGALAAAGGVCGCLSRGRAATADSGPLLHSPGMLDQPIAALPQVPLPPPPPLLRHAVLLVNGVSEQRSDAADLGGVAQALQARVNALVDTVPEEVGRGHVQVLPVEWRRNAILEADVVGQRDLKHEARKVQAIAQKTYMEAAWYLAPARAQLLADSVAATLNATVLRFIRRNPAFSGGISIIAHSLGSAMVCDLLAHQPYAPRSSLCRALDARGGAFAEVVAAAAPPRPPRPPDASRAGGSGSARSGRAAARVAAVAALQERNAQRLGETIYGGSGGRSSAASSRKRLPPASPDAGGPSTPTRRTQYSTLGERDGDPANAPETPAISPPEAPAQAAPIGEATAKLRRKARSSRSRSAAPPPQHAALAPGSSEGQSGGTTHMHPYPPAPALHPRPHSASGQQSVSHSGEGPLTGSESSGQRASLVDEYSLRPSSLGTTNDAISVSGWGADGTSSPEVHQDQPALTLRPLHDELRPASATAQAHADSAGGFMWLSPRGQHARCGRSAGASRGHSRPPSRGDSRGSGSMGYYTAFSSTSGGGSLGGSQGDSLGQPLGEGLETPNELRSQALRAHSATEAYGAAATEPVVHPSSISETGSMLRAAAAAAPAGAGGSEELFHDPVGAVPSLEPPKRVPSPMSPMMAPFRTEGATGARCAVLPDIDETRVRGQPRAAATARARSGPDSEEDTSSRELEAMGSLALRSWPGREAVVTPFSQRAADGGSGSGRGSRGSPHHFTTSTTTATGGAIDLRSEVAPFWSGSGGWHSIASSDGAAAGAAGVGVHAQQWMPMHEAPDKSGSPGQAVDAKDRWGAAPPPQLPPLPGAPQRNAPQRDAREIELQAAFTFSQPQDSPAGRSSGRGHMASPPEEGDSRRSRGGSGESRRRPRPVEAPQHPGLPLREQESTAAREWSRAAHTPATPSLSSGSLLRRRGTEQELAERYQLGDLQEIEEVVATSTEISFLPSSPGFVASMDGLAAQRVALARALWPGRQLKALDSTQFAPEEVATTTLAYPELCFEVDNFIMLGSPVGMLSALKGVQPARGRALGSRGASPLFPHSPTAGLPLCKRWFNVWHQHDLMAYRVEPLLRRRCGKPLRLPRSRGTAIARPHSFSPAPRRASTPYTTQEGDQVLAESSMVDVLLGAAPPLAPPQSPASLAARPVPFAGTIPVAGDGRESGRSTPTSRRRSIAELAPEMTSPSGSLSPTSYRTSHSRSAPRPAGRDAGAGGGSRASSVHGSRSPSVAGVLSGRQSQALRQPASGRASAISSASSSYAEVPSARSSRAASLPPLPAAASGDAAGILRGRPQLRGHHPRSFAPRPSSARSLSARRRPGSARTAAGRGRLASREDRDATVVPDPRVRAEAQLILQEQLRKHLGLVQEESIEDALPLGAGFRTPGGPAHAVSLTPGRLPPMDPEAVNEAVRRLALIGGAPPVDLGQRPGVSRSAPVTSIEQADRPASPLHSVASEQGPLHSAARAADDQSIICSSTRLSSDLPSDRPPSATVSAPSALEANMALIDPAVTLSALAGRSSEDAPAHVRTASQHAERPLSAQDSATPTTGTAAGGSWDGEDGDGSVTAAIAGAVVAAAIRDTPSPPAGAGHAEPSSSESLSPLSLHQAPGDGDADTHALLGSPDAALLGRSCSDAALRHNRDSGAMEAAVMDSATSASLLLPPLRFQPGTSAAQVLPVPDAGASSDGDGGASDGDGGGRLPPSARRTSESYAEAAAAAPDSAASELDSACSEPPFFALNQTDCVPLWEGPRTSRSHSSSRSSGLSGLVPPLLIQRVRRLSPRLSPAPPPVPPPRTPPASPAPAPAPTAATDPSAAAPAAR
eukprot:jgi/Ulvmu1/7745/UM039_0053.1